MSKKKPTAKVSTPQARTEEPESPAMRPTVTVDRKKLETTIQQMAMLDFGLRGFVDAYQLPCADGMAFDLEFQLGQLLLLASEARTDADGLIPEDGEQEAVPAANDKAG